MVSSEYIYYIASFIKFIDNYLDLFRSSVLFQFVCECIRLWVTLTDTVKCCYETIRSNITRNLVWQRWQCEILFKNSGNLWLTMVRFTFANVMRLRNPCLIQNHVPWWWEYCGQLNALAYTSTIICWYANACSFGISSWFSNQ